MKVSQARSVHQIVLESFWMNSYSSQYQCSFKSDSKFVYNHCKIQIELIFLRILGREDLHVSCSFSGQIQADLGTFLQIHCSLIRHLTKIHWPNISEKQKEVLHVLNYKSSMQII